MRTALVVCFVISLAAISCSSDWSLRIGEQAVSCNDSDHPNWQCVEGDSAIWRCEELCPRFCEDMIENVGSTFFSEKGLSCPDVCDDLSATWPAIIEFKFNISTGTCIYYLTTQIARDIEFLSVVPGYQGNDGLYTRQCESDSSSKVNALLMSFAIEGTVFSSHSDTADRDPAVRPEDVLRILNGDRVMVTVAPDSVGPGSVSKKSFDVRIDCLDPYPDASSDGECTRPLSLSGPPENVIWAGNLSGGTLRPSLNGPGVSLAIMLDQSGSMKGLVANPGFEEINLRSKAFNATDLAKLATDWTGYRFAAIQDLMSILNVNDRAGIFVFGEAVDRQAAKIVCDHDTNDETLNRTDCFGIDRDIIDSEAFKRLQSEPKGRTPLWTAVKDVYTFLKENETESLARHIFLITDGPDTCAEKSPDFMPFIRYYRESAGLWLSEDQGAPCSDTGWQDFRDFIHDDVMNPDGTPKPVDQIPVHISIVQIQSRGYPDIDPAQQEVACLTGGHYRFVNLNEMNHDHENQKYQVLTESAFKFRMSISGSWQAAVPVPKLATGQLEPGSIMAIEGSITVTDVEDDPFNDDIKSSDFKGSFRTLGTGSETDCSWLPLIYADKDSGKSEECRIAEFSTENGVCTAGDSAYASTCLTGTCCYGVCMDPVNECNRIDELCNVVKLNDGTECTGGTCLNGACSPSSASSSK